MRFDKSFESLGFLVLLQCIFMLFLISSWTVSSEHLRLEQEWSAELLSQNTHSIEVIARQNKYIYELERILEITSPTLKQN